jgi:hypothetical protein
MCYPSNLMGSARGIDCIESKIEAFMAVALLCFALTSIGCDDQRTSDKHCLVRLSDAGRPHMILICDI